MSNDILTELRQRGAAIERHGETDWTYDDAADEIERLRSLTRFQDGVIRSGNTACLTQAERDDLACAVSRLESDPNGPRDLQVADTLRGLLERLGGGR